MTEDFHLIRIKNLPFSGSKSFWINRDRSNCFKQEYYNILRPDEPSFNIGMDLSGRLFRSCSFIDGSGFEFVLANRKKGD